SRSLLCSHHSCELEIPLYPPYRFFNRDYIVFDCGGMAFSEANLKPFVRVCSSLPGEPHARTQLSGGSGPIAGGSSAIRTLARNGVLGDHSREVPVTSTGV
ncbi:MAG: hypothetical protein LAQ69_43780, partial [Acidobacteriia bacterium]|nr:hypothetical protein [Terriglobia bacterium]